MNEGVGHALDQAMAFWRAPALLASARHRPLPDDVLEVVRIAAGDSSAAEQGAEATGADAAEVTEASAFYLQQLLFAPGADSYRVLGVNPGADDARIKEHYRWLVRWLHPDRNPDEWEALYADRVNRAWQDLRNPEKRAAYDASLETSAAAPSVGGTSVPNTQTPTPFPRRPVGTEVPPTGHSEPLLSATTTRRLPYLVLGGFGALAGAVLALMWYAQGIQPARVLPPTNAPLPVATASAKPALPALDLPTPPVGAPSGANLLPLNLPAAQQSFAPEGAPTEQPAPPQPQTRIATAPEAATTPTPPPVTPASPRPTATAPVGGTSVPISQPASAPPITADTLPPPPPPITEPAAQALLDQFTQAYARGDLPTLMRLFSSDATNNRGGREAIAYDYQELFDQTRKRQLLLQRQGWLQTESSATVLARFEARVTPSGGLISRSSRGNIRFDLGWENGSLRIRGVRHDEE